MTKKNHFTENDRIFYSDGYKLAQTAIEGGFSNESLFSAIESLYAAIDSLNDSILSYSEKQNRQIACHKGCEWCCHQAVFANSFELHYLSEKIKNLLSQEDFDQVLINAESKRAITSALNEKEILKYKSPCPLLQNGSCSIYILRPMACRIYLSYKLATCLEFYNHPDNDNNYPALLDFPLRAGRMMNEGFGAALKEIGIASAEFKLEEGLCIALKNGQPNFGL